MSEAACGVVPVSAMVMECDARVSCVVIIVPARARGLGLEPCGISHAPAAEGGVVWWSGGDGVSGVMMVRHGGSGEE